MRIFLLAELLKTPVLILKKPQKMSNYTNPIFDMLITTEAARGGVKIQPEERHCLPGGVLLLAAVYCHRVTLAAAADASLDNKMHTLI